MKPRIPLPKQRHKVHKDLTKYDRKNNKITESLCSDTCDNCTYFTCIDTEKQRRYNESLQQN